MIAVHAAGNVVPLPARPVDRRADRARAPFQVLRDRAQGRLELVTAGPGGRQAGAVTWSVEQLWIRDRATGAVTPLAAALPDERALRATWTGRGAVSISITRVVLGRCERLVTIRETETVTSTTGGKPAVTTFTHVTTIDADTGRALRLSDVLPPLDARAALRFAARAIAAHDDPYLQDAARDGAREGDTRAFAVETRDGKLIVRVAFTQHSARATAEGFAAHARPILVAVHAAVPVRAAPTQSPARRAA